MSLVSYVRTLLSTTHVHSIQLRRLAPHVQLSADAALASAHSLDGRELDVKRARPVHPLPARAVPAGSPAPDVPTPAGAPLDAPWRHTPYSVPPPPNRAEGASQPYWLAPMPVMWPPPRWQYVTFPQSPPWPHAGMLPQYSAPPPPPHMRVYPGSPQAVHWATAGDGGVRRPGPPPGPATAAAPVTVSPIEVARQLPGPQG